MGLTAAQPGADGAAATLIRSRGAPIGVFDSGLGGLSIVRALQAELPNEHVVYYADSAFCPYGDRDEEFIRDRTLRSTAELQKQGAKAIVIACNTACACALEPVRQHLDIPVIGLEPAVKPAVAMTHTGRIAVFATARTVASDRLGTLIRRFGSGVEVELVAATEWVELVERNRSFDADSQDAVAKLVLPVIERGADVLVLGCTHFPFLASLIQQIAGPGVTIVDSGPAVARQTRHVLESRNLLASTRLSSGGIELFTSAADGEGIRMMAAKLAGVSLPVTYAAGI